jgi:hypothetical protein
MIKGNDARIGFHSNSSHWTNGLGHVLGFFTDLIPVILVCRIDRTAVSYQAWSNQQVKYSNTVSTEDCDFRGWGVKLMGLGNYGSGGLIESTVSEFLILEATGIADSFIEGVVGNMVAYYSIS